MWAHVSAPSPIPSHARPDLPEELDEVIARGMAKDPSERYASAGELARAAALALGLVPQLSSSDTQLQAANETPEPRALTVVSDEP